MALPLHLEFLRRYLEGKSEPVTDLPPEARAVLRQVIEGPGGYSPSIMRAASKERGAVRLPANEIDSRDWDMLRQLGWKPALSPYVVSKLYSYHPDSWQDVLGGSTPLQLSRSLGAFTATPDTLRNVWKVYDRYQIDKADTGEDTGVESEEFKEHTKFSRTPTYTVHRLIKSRGKNFDVRIEVPMSPQARQALVRYVRTGRYSSRQAP